MCGTGAIIAVVIGGGLGRGLSDASVGLVSTHDRLVEAGAGGRR